MKGNLRLWVRLLGMLCLGLIFFFLFRELWVNWRALQRYSWKLNPSLAVGSFFLLTFSLFLLPWGLARVLVLLGHPLPYRRVCKILFSSLLAKYLPGGWWAFVGRAHFYSREGFNLSQASLAVLIETILVVTSGILVFSAFSQVPSVLLGDFQKALLILLGAICLALLHPYFLNPLLSLFGRILKKPVTLMEYPYYKMVYPFVIFSLFWVGMGGSFWLLCRSLVDIDLAQLPRMLSAFSLSWIIGFFSFLTPGGLGVREGALTLLLQPSFPLYAAAALSLLSRVWWICGEVLAWILSVGWERWAGIGSSTYSGEKRTRPGLMALPEKKKA